MLQRGSGHVSMLKDHFDSKCSRIVPLVTSSGHLGCLHSMRAVLRINPVAVMLCLMNTATPLHTASHFKLGVSKAGGAYIPKVGTHNVLALQVPHKLPIPILTDVALHVMQKRAQPLDLIVGVPKQQGALAGQARHGPSLGSRSRRPRLMFVLSYSRPSESSHCGGNFCRLRWAYNKVRKLILQLAQLGALVTRAPSGRAQLSCRLR
jgi:hypothetical protein